MIGTARGIANTVTQQVERGRALAARPLLAGYVLDADPVSSGLVVLALANTCALKLERLAGCAGGRWVMEADDRALPEEDEWAMAIVNAAANRAVMGAMDAWQAVPWELRPAVAANVITCLEHLREQELARGMA